MDHFTKFRLDQLKARFIQRVCRYRSLKEANSPQMILDEEARLIEKALKDISIPELGPAFLVDVMMNYEKHFEEFKKERISPPLLDDAE